jgi:benzoyl-CoA reductase subunit C
MEKPDRIRFPHLLKLAKDYRAQGAILMQQKFCDPHETNTPSLRRFFESNGIPTYFLEFEVTVLVGQFRIRVEAFIEQIQAEELFT